MSLNVRLATLDDVDDIIRLATMIGVNSMFSKLSVDLTKLRGSITDFVLDKSGDRFVLVSVDGDKVVGSVAGYCYAPLMTHEKIAVEVLLALDEEFKTLGRGKEMMDAYEYWAKMKGCRQIQYGFLTEGADPRMKKMYERRGFTMGEETFYKMIG